MIDDVIRDMNKLVGFRGTVEEIAKKMSEIADEDITVTKSEIDNSPDINYVATAGLVISTYLDWDLFVLETREEGVLYITEITFLG